MNTFEIPLLSVKCFEPFIKGCDLDTFFSRLTLGTLFY